MLPRLEVFIENHKARDCGAMVRAVASQNRLVRAFTDTSDHYQLKGHQRWRGNWENYRSILEAARRSQAADWCVVMQDDVSVPPGLFDRMAHILQFMPGNVGAFYVPQNALYTKAVELGVHVVETYQNFWIQAMAFRRSRLPVLYQWAEEHIHRAWLEDGDGSSDDDFCVLACSSLQWPCRVILPSLVQHEGYAESLMKTSGKVAGYERVSAVYDPTFDPTTVDWEAAFRAPLIDRSRIGRSDRRMQRTKGLL